MSILEGIKEKAKHLVGKDNQSIGVISQLFTDTGGGNALAEKFNSAGLGDVLKSWLSPGVHQSITAEQIEKVVGVQEIQRLATKYGLEANEVNSLLATNLPKVVEKLSANGQLPSAAEIKDKLVDMKSFFH